MNASKPSTIHSAALATLLLFSMGAQAKIVCWENSDGVRECGNAVPPEYAQKQRETFNEQGRVTEVKERAKTPEEIAAEEARVAEEKRIEAEKQKLIEAQETYDRVLLATYLSEKDIIRSRNRQSASIDSTIDVTRKAIDKLQEKLDEDRKKAANYERRSKPLPERLQSSITSLQQQINDKNSFIASKEEEKQRLFARFDEEIERFRELKAEQEASR